MNKKVDKISEFVEENLYQKYLIVFGKNKNNFIYLSKEKKNRDEEIKNLKIYSDHLMTNQIGICDCYINEKGVKIKHICLFENIPDKKYFSYISSLSGKEVDNPQYLCGISTGFPEIVSNDLDVDVEYVIKEWELIGLFFSNNISQDIQKIIEV